MYIHSPVSSATYSASGANVTAIEAGSVHGVVVQMMVANFLGSKTCPTRLSSFVLLVRRSSIFAGSLVSAYRTQMLGLVCISYSTSASANAVLSYTHQYTDFRPL